MACANCMASARVTPLRGSPERDPERDPERGFACLCFSLRGTRACALSVLGPNGIPSLFAGTAPAKLRAYLWALKSKIRGRCFFRIMDLSFSCG